MPGLLRGVARTAVVAGTATAVSGRVRRRQDAKFAAKDAETAEPEEAAAPEAPEAAAPQVPQQRAPADAPDPLDELKKLGDLKAQGILTEEEFAAQKAKILGS